MQQVDVLSGNADLNSQIGLAAAYMVLLIMRKPRA